MQARIADGNPHEPVNGYYNGLEASLAKTAVRENLGSIDGVVGFDVQPDKITLLVRDSSVAEAIKKVAPNMTFRDRPIEIEVTGDIKKQVAGPVNESRDPK